MLLIKRKANGASPTLRLATLGALCLSAALAFTACLATSEAAGALEFSALLTVGEARMSVKPGVTLQVLQWLAFGFTLLFTITVPWLLRGGGAMGDMEKY